MPSAKRSIEGSRACERDVRRDCRAPGEVNVKAEAGGVRSGGWEGRREVRIEAWEGSSRERSIEERVGGGGFVEGVGGEFDCEARDSQAAFSSSRLGNVRMGICWIL